MNKKKLRLASLSFLSITITVLAVAYYVEKQISPIIVIDDIRIDSDSLLVMNSMKHTSSRNGVTEWTLQARSARLLRDHDRALLDEPAVTFFLKDGTAVNARAEKGELDTKNHDIIFSENVVLTYIDTVMKTDQLQYEKKTHIIYSKVPVTIKNPSALIESDMFHLDINQGTAKFDGHVTAVFFNLN
ncbi:MAG: LPS export ABC transporter periplasmic protein LptC [Desulfamplus sp.]|nr:LPS export ABC transporter periplasmic protein LptC [Desulfamplus sp.]